MCNVQSGAAGYPVPSLTLCCACIGAMMVCTAVGTQEGLGASCRDAEVKEEGFLEYINQLLMTGEVAGLLPKEELDGIMNDVRPAFKRDCIGASFHPLCIRRQLVGMCRITMQV